MSKKSSSTHSDSMLNQLADLPIEIQATDIVPPNCGFTESDTSVAQNFKPSDTGPLAKCFKQKLESKLMLTANVDVLEKEVGAGSI